MAKAWQRGEGMEGSGKSHQSGGGCGNDDGQEIVRIQNDFHELFASQHPFTRVHHQSIGLPQRQIETLLVYLANHIPLADNTSNDSKKACLFND